MRPVLVPAANILLVGAWLWLVRPSLEWIADNLASDSGRLNLVLVLGIIGLAAWRLWETGRRGHRLPLPRFSFRPLPAALLLLGGLAFIGAEYAVGVNRISVVAASLGSYGLIGLYVPPSWWRRGLAPGLLIIVALPFAELLDIYLGFPARLLTAEIVHDALRGIASQQISSQTILVFENGAAQVDLPCSGVKSLWAGAVLSLAITWLDGRRMDWRWLICNFFYVGLLFAANVCRVFTLVTAGLVLGRPRLADLLHVPLGLIGFALASLVLLGLLRWFVPAVRGTELPATAPIARSSVWQRFSLASSVGVMLLLHTPRPAPAVDRPEAQLALPAEISSCPVALTPLETEHFHEQGAMLAEKHRFVWRGLSGSVLVVLSDTFRAHHLPDRCLAGTGLEIEDRATVLIAPDFPVSWVEFKGHAGMATYWFQSNNQITEDYSARVWADLSDKQRRWVMVTVLFDRSTDETNPHPLLHLIHNAVAASLLGGTP